MSVLLGLSGPPSNHQPKTSIKHKIHKKNRKTTKINKKETFLDSVPIFSANGAGVIKKIPSLVSSVNELGAGIITLQETHFTRKGKLADKLSDFEIFEAMRKKQKGGTLIGVHKSLDPILIEEYSEDFELSVVEVNSWGERYSSYFRLRSAGELESR